jgi:hypothetical protein
LTIWKGLAERPHLCRDPRIVEHAHVDVYAEGELMKFAESVAVNRGVPVMVFASVGEAELWLLGLDDTA